MSDAKSMYEVAADITIAMIARLSLETRIGSDGASEITPEYLAPKIAEAFKVIYAGVVDAVDG